MQKLFIKKWCNLGIVFWSKFQSSVRAIPVPKEFIQRPPSEGSRILSTFKRLSPQRWFPFFAPATAFHSLEDKYIRPAIPLHVSTSFRAFRSTGSRFKRSLTELKISGKQAVTVKMQCIVIFNDIFLHLSAKHSLRIRRRKLINIKIETFKNFINALEIDITILQSWLRLSRESSDDKKRVMRDFSCSSPPYFATPLCQRSTKRGAKNIILRNFLIAGRKRFNFVPSLELQRRHYGDTGDATELWRRNVVGPHEKTYISRAVWKVTPIEGECDTRAVVLRSSSLSIITSPTSHKKRQLARDRSSFILLISPYIYARAH